MAPTDTSEWGLESLIVDSLLTESGYQAGNSEDYDREHAVDWASLFRFLENTQPELCRQLELEVDGPKRRQFLSRLSRQLQRRGVLNVLRSGVSRGQYHVDLYYPLPSEGNPEAERLYAQNIFSVTRQLRYSSDERARALDLVIFINGLPVATMELKNNLTKQTVSDAVAQYKRDRDPREPIFAPGRCAVHLAVDDQEVRMCAKLAGAQSWFLPFNKGYDGGAGNPPNPDGLKDRLPMEGSPRKEQPFGCAGELCTGCGDY